MNEVSNGPSGNKEYVEFVVVDTAAYYDCGLSTPPCIDIRGWIFDDNSGYHGAGGVAAGAVRFSFDPLWSCVPLGTIILIYNDADPNADVPATDLSLGDGNCRIVAPISSALFELNLTTPGAIACSYPSTGWTSGGAWSSTLLANAGDCARIVDLAGCEVFSVCWASCSTSTLIYFSSAGSGTDNVWYFNDGDPNDQVNWSEGCTDPGACGSNQQTPGSANNSANAAYIAQFNNGCTPIAPVSSSIASFTNAGCTCDGTATAAASGSIAGYTYEWYDSGFVSIGQSGATATGLCAGTYYVVATSSIGCADTSSVIITSGGTAPAVNVSAFPSATICAGDTTVLTGSGAVTYTWTPATGLSSASGTSVDAFPSGNTTYIVTGTNASGCSDTASISITVNPLPVINIPPVPDVCENLAPFLVGATPSGGNWSGTAITAGGMFDPSGLSGSSSTVTYTVTNSNGCTASSSTIINVDALPVINFTPPGILCDGDAPLNLTASPTGGTWSGTGITDGSLGTFDPAVSGAGTFVIDYTVTNGACITTSTLNVTVSTGSSVSITPAGPYCETQTVVTLGATPAGGTWSGTGITSGGVFEPSASGPGTYQFIYNSDSSGSCANSDTITVVVDSNPAFTLTPEGPFCETESPVILGASLAGGSWSGTGITNAATGAFDPSLVSAGSTSVTYTVTNGACTNAQSMTITVDDFTAVDITAAGPFCDNAAAINLSATPAGGTWSGTGITSATLGTFDPSTLAPGTYTVTYTFTNGECTSSNTTSITVMPGINVTIAPLGPLLFCEGNSVTLVAVGAGSNTVTWSNGTVSDTLIASQPGNYYAWADAGCGADTSDVFAVNVFVVDPSFTLDPASGQNPLTVTVINTTANTFTYYWSVADTVYGSNSDTSIVYNDPGTYAITLYVATTDGCIDSLTQTVYVYGSFALTVPNVFTPNSDDMNDAFSVVVAGIGELKVEVFNRWGQLMTSYASTTVIDGTIPVWDGMHNGQNASDGTYGYILTAIGFEGQSQTVHGFVTLITK
ncbi:MAG TPA: gliding motility-associated C-terminal domain-containing protein [Flavobacteriales bacterium]|nr:gliding motility-associated C-terminal domain-containing protein [Flavobacteriales bacterium]